MLLESGDKWGPHTHVSCRNLCPCKDMDPWAHQPLSLTHKPLSLSPSLSLLPLSPMEGDRPQHATRVAKCDNLGLTRYAQAVELDSLRHPDAAASRTLKRWNLTVRLGGADPSAVDPVPTTKCGRIRRGWPRCDNHLECSRAEGRHGGTRCDGHPSPDLE